MSKIQCFKCKGRGYTGFRSNLLATFLTAGWAKLGETAEECDACNGKGWLEA